MSAGFIINYSQMSVNVRSDCICTCPVSSRLVSSCLVFSCLVLVDRCYLFVFCLCLLFALCLCQYAFCLFPCLLCRRCGSPVLFCTFRMLCVLSLLLFLSFICHLQCRALSLLRWCVGSFLFPSVLTLPSCVWVRLVIDARWCFFHMCACLIVQTHVRVCLLSQTYFARVCVCVCSCVSVFTMLHSPVLVSSSLCVCVYVYMYICPCQCMCLSLWLELFLDSKCCGAGFLVVCVVVSFITITTPCEKSKFFVLWEECGRCVKT